MAGSPPEDYFPLGWISYGTNPPHLKDFFWGGSKICRQASCFACGDAKLQHLRDLQPIVFNRESIQGHGPTIAEPCIPYCGGGGAHPLIRSSDYSTISNLYVPVACVGETQATSSICEELGSACHFLDYTLPVVLFLNHHKGNVKGCAWSMIMSCYKDMMKLSFHPRKVE